MSLMPGFLNKKSIIVILIAVAALLSVMAFRSCDKESVVKYSFSEVNKGDVFRTVNINGSLELYSVENVRSLVGGEVSVIHKRYNDVVAVGDLLMEIYSESAVESYEQYVDTYRFARIDLQNSRDLFLTKKKLFEEELISSMEYENARLAYQKQLSNFKRVEKTYLQRKELLDGRMVHSPSGGLIVKSYREEGGEISSGSVLYQIAPTLEKMRLSMNIDESDVGVVKKDQKVSFTVSAYPEEVFYGELDLVTMSPETIDNVVTYEALATVRNKNNYLKPGMTASATIHVAESKKVMRVPNQAFLVTPKEIETKPGEKVIWKKISAADDQMPVAPVSIKVGVSGDAYTEIISDEIEVGDEILVGIVIEK
ncbi:MAG: efflux RND transporter periplasmic adaptor subunit [Spirochaetes bacterium]|jgi:HlyD family secretion protein|nr:efflux RND transporter periplasmic adaptor subunit [Spirochaetota bacterium]